ncbi:MAG: DUF4856 domain-containing protein [Saprospiraceae bacterium]|nr:DUF4856 domain-containing protein [Saprospiraceae bacterium]
MGKKYIIGLFTIALAISACKKDKGEYTVPTTYNFENVSYSGQTDRLNMMEEMTTYMKTAHSNGAAALDATKLKDMYSNSNSQFTDANLNSSTKQIKSKTISSMQANFESYMDAIVVASQSTSETAADGQAGIMTKVDGSSSYLLNANGVELTQIIEKGLMGACFYYQGTAVYLGSGKMDVDNETVVEGEGTEMEHHWDEAFGYFGVATDFPTNVADVRFWGKYCNKRNELLGTNATLMDGFLKGRAAISNNDLTSRDEAITTIQTNWEIVCAATAINYLNSSKSNLTSDPAAAHHGLSEAYAFIMSLKYGAVKSLTDAQVNSILTALAGSDDPLQANLYGVTETKIDAAVNSLAGYYSSLESVKTQL